jgi:lysozyme
MIKTTRILSPAGLDLIKANEGHSLRVYLCPANRATIGYGHVLLPKWDCGLFRDLDAKALARIINDFQSRRRISREDRSLLHINQAQADELLAKDTRQVARFLDSVVQSALNQNQFDALCSLVFNIGQGNFASSALKTKLRDGDFARAAAEFDRWVYGVVDGRKQKLPGLIARRAAERKLFEAL